MAEMAGGKNGSRQPAVGSRQRVPVPELPVADYRFPVPGCRLPVAGSRLPIPYSTTTAVPLTLTMSMLPLPPTVS